MKCPYTYPHRSRAAKAAYIAGIGGYSVREGRCPIEFNVGTYYVDLDFESLWAAIKKEFPLVPEDERLLREACSKVYEEVKDHLYEWALDDARRNIDEKECDTYYMLWDGRRVDASWELHGRNGKHLVLVGFEGVKLLGLTEEELEFMLNDQQDDYGNSPDTPSPKLRPGYEWVVPTEQLDLLYRYIRQCEIDFTPQKASQEVSYSAQWILYSRAEDEAVRMREAIAAKDTLQEKAKVLYDALDMEEEELREAWRDLCVAAGLSPSDIMY